MTGKHCVIKDAELKALCRKAQEAADHLYDLQQQVIEAKKAVAAAEQAVRAHRYKDPASIAGKVDDALMERVVDVVAGRGPLAGPQIASMIGTPLPVVYEALRRLSNRGRLLREMKPGRRTVYTVKHEQAALAG